MHNRNVSIKSDDSGFSMIEMLIAMAVFAIGSLAIVSMYYSTSGGLRQSDEVTQAVYVADNYLSRILMVGYAAMPASVGTFAEGKYTVNIAITPTTPVPKGNTTINVTVNWNNMFGSTKSYSIDYFRAETRSSGI